jgi:hypothetical protein
MASKKGFMEGMREKRSGKSGSKMHERMESKSYKAAERKGEKKSKRGC